MTISKVTYSGRLIDVLNVEAADISFLDIAHSLSNIQRFNGGATRSLSVARHSLNVSNIVLEDTGSRVSALYGLLHDAHEYITGDITTPIKAAIKKLSNGDPLGVLQNSIDRAIFSAANLPDIMDARIHHAVKIADEKALSYEVKNFIAPTSYDWGLKYDYTGHLEGTLSPEFDKVDFMSRLSFLMVAVNANR